MSVTLVCLTSTYSMYTLLALLSWEVVLVVLLVGPRPRPCLGL